MSTYLCTKNETMAPLYVATLTVQRELPKYEMWSFHIVLLLWFSPDQVTNGGRASNAGLLPGDYILSINSMETKTMRHLQAQQTIKNSKTTIVLHW